jgi:hypothetical protein
MSSEPKQKRTGLSCPFDAGWGQATRILSAPLKRGRKEGYRRSLPDHEIAFLWLLRWLPQADAYTIARALFDLRFDDLNIEGGRGPRNAVENMQRRGLLPIKGKPPSILATLFRAAGREGLPILCGPAAALAYEALDRLEKEPFTRLWRQ